MAKNITIAGASYQDVPGVILNTTEGGTAKFVDTSGDTVTAETLLLGYTAHGADGEPITGTLEAGGGSGVDIETGLLYKLPGEKTFNGTSDYIDTGVKLFDTAKDFTILVDCTMTPGQAANYTPIFHCQHEVSPYYGLSLTQEGGSAQNFLTGGGAGNGNGYIGYTRFAQDGKRHRILITGKAGVITNIRARNAENNFYKCDRQPNTYHAIQETCLLGCLQTTAGVKQRFWKGTMYDFRIWDRALSYKEVLGASILPDTDVEAAVMGVMFNKNIEELEIPGDKMSIIAASAFANCQQLVLTEIPEGIVQINNYAFQNCFNISDLTLPVSLKVLNGNAFINCAGLTRVTFKSEPTTLGSAFNSCSKLTTINVPWAEGAVSGAPWGATNATINYNYVSEPEPY